jgi:hypothetical protein
VKLLNGGETNIDVVWIGAVKIGYSGHLNPPIINCDDIIEQVLDGSGVKKIVFCLFDNIEGIDEENEITVTLLI